MPTTALPRIVFGLAALGTLVAANPEPPCGKADVFPAYPEVDHAPVVQAWDKDAKWTPPGCTGWKEPGFSSLVATVGRFRVPGGAQGLLRRIGAISELQGIRYWSTTHQAWKTLIASARALDGSTAGRARKDFTPEELALNKSLYFEQEDNLTGKAVYQMRARSVSPDRMVFDSENVSAMKFLFVTVFHPGEMQTIYFLDREGEDVWRFYSLTRTGVKASSLVVGHDASSINRAVAMYRHLAGIPTDQEPPAAR